MRYKYIKEIKKRIPRYAIFILITSLIINSIDFPVMRAQTKTQTEQYVDVLNRYKNYIDGLNSTQKYGKKKNIKNETAGPEIKPEKDTAKEIKIIKPEEPAKNEYSGIENMFNTAFNVSLQQYGYDYFKQFVKEKFLPVGDRYRVGPGDSIALYFWGDPVDLLGLNGFYTLSVDRDGKVYIPQVGVFYVWGLEIGKIKEIVFNAMRKKFRRFSIEVTLGKLREFPVYVSGYVNQPGIVLASGVNNVVDVLSLAGGIAKNGSLRNIIIRRNEKGSFIERKIDLYNLLINGKPSKMIIREGDSILVKPIAETIGIDGVVKRPAIYEISGNNTIEKAIELAGGILPSVYSPGIALYRYRNNKLSIREGNLEDKEFLQTGLKDGDYVIIKNLYNLVENEIVVTGHVGYPGKYSFKQGIKLSEILGRVGILPDTNMYSANIRRNEEKKVFPFSPRDVLAGKSDFPLKKRDVINFYARWVYNPIMVTGEVNNSRIIPYYENITLLDVLQQVELKKSPQDLKAEIFEENEKTGTENKSVTIYLQELLVKASKKANVELSPGSKILIRTTDELEKGKTLTVLGEVKNPGVYNFKPGMTLYELIKQVGGYSDIAYPRGLIFIRRSAMKLQEEQIRISLLSMKESLAKQQEAYSNLGTNPEDRAVVQMVLQQYERMLGILKEKSQMTLGRIALDLPDNVEDLKEHPDNIRLVEDDYIFIPQKPSYILVLGDVYNQMSLPYDTGKTVEYYINQMGGIARHASEDDIYIIKANGKIISRQQFKTVFQLYFILDWDRNKLRFARNFDNMVLEEGDTIVVPTEIKVPVMWRSVLRDIAQIMFQSIATAVLATKL